MPTVITFANHAELRRVSPSAAELFFGVLARSSVDELGPVVLPRICWKAGRELVKYGLAQETGRGCFSLSKGRARLVHRSPDPIEPAAL